MCTSRRFSNQRSGEPSWPPHSAGRAEVSTSMLSNPPAPSRTTRTSRTRSSPATSPSRTGHATRCRVVDEIKTWEGHPSEVLQGMLDNIARLRENGSTSSTTDRDGRRVSVTPKVDLTPSTAYEPCRRRGQSSPRCQPQTFPPVAAGSRRRENCPRSKVEARVVAGHVNRIGVMVVAAFDGVNQGRHDLAGDRAVLELVAPTSQPPGRSHRTRSCVDRPFIGDEVDIGHQPSRRL